MSPKPIRWRLCATLAFAATMAAGASAGQEELWQSMVARSQPRLAGAAQTETPAAAPERQIEPPAQATMAETDSRIAPPAFSRIVIARNGILRIEGQGTPGSQVLISSAGQMLASAVVEKAGTWSVTLERALATGDHEIASAAAGRTEVRFGDVVRISMPAELTEGTVIAYETTAHTGALPDDSPSTDAARSRAEDLANAASRRFNEIMTEKEARQRVAQAPSPDRTNPPANPVPPMPDIVAPVFDWLERSAKGYQGGIIKNLSVPNAGQAPAGDKDAVAGRPVAPVPAPPPASESQTSTAGNFLDRVRKWFSGGSQSDQPDVAEPRPGPEEEPGTKGGTAAQRSAELARKKADAKRRADAAAEDYIAEKRRVDEASRRARARAAEEAKGSAEARRAAEEAARRSAEDAELKAREDKRAAEAARRKEDETKRLQDAAKQIEERKAKKDAEAAAKKAAEAKRSEDKRAAEALKAAEDARRIEEARKAAEAKRIAGENDRKAAAAKTKPEEPRRGVAEAPETQSEAAAEAEAEVRGPNASEQGVEEETPDVSEAPDRSDNAEPDEPRRNRSTAKRSHDRSQRTAAKSGRVRAAKVLRSAARSKGWIARHTAKRAAGGSCRQRVIARCRGTGTYVVKAGDSLWAIANRQYCTGVLYQAIYRANRKRIVDPDLIYPSMRLRLPRKAC